METTEQNEPPTPRLIPGYDEIVGQAWRERARGNHVAAQLILESAGITPMPEGDGR